MRDPPCWARYIADSLIETSISRDVLLLTRVDKPALAFKVRSSSQPAGSCMTVTIWT